MTHVTLQYFDDCPNWRQTLHDLEALKAEGAPLTFRVERIASEADAIDKGFRGSPTVLIDGVDPFADPSAPVGLACRIYRSPSGGLAGRPTRDQLRRAVAG